MNFKVLNSGIFSLTWTDCIPILSYVFLPNNVSHKQDLKLANTPTGRCVYKKLRRYSSIARMPS